MCCSPCVSSADRIASMNSFTSGGGKISGIFFPINPSGGLMGAGHPVGASGVRMALDIYKQVTDQAGEYQVGGAKNGLMLNIGGSATTSMTFVIGQADS